MGSNPFWNLLFSTIFLSSILIGFRVRVRVRLRVRISDLLAYITYFIVTVIIRLVQCAANLAAAGVTELCLPRKISSGGRHCSSGK